MRLTSGETTSVSPPLRPSARAPGSTKTSRPRSADRQGVVPLEDAGDHLLLARPEVLEAEDRSEDASCGVVRGGALRPLRVVGRVRAQIIPSSGSAGLGAGRHTLPRRPTTKNGRVLPSRFWWWMPIALTYIFRLLPLTRSPPFRGDLLRPEGGSRPRTESGPSQLSGSERGLPPFSRRQSPSRCGHITTMLNLGQKREAAKLGHK